MKTLLNYPFEFVENISPVVDDDGNIKVYYPQDQYYKKNITPLNKYGEGAFCKFSIDPKWSGKAGVYAIFFNDQLSYIGQCVDFAIRFNTGYGNIAPINCYVGGQSTNCKINKLVLNAVEEQKTVALYFYATRDYDAVERKLITHYQPVHNTALKDCRYTGDTSQTKHIPHKTSVAKVAENPSINEKIGIAEIKQYIEGLFVAAIANGMNEIVLVSGDIHKMMSLSNKMPSVCSAMYVLKKENDIILSTTPSGKSSTITIKYFLAL